MKDSLIDLNDEGIIPREDEEFAEFFKRASELKKLSDYGFRFFYSKENLKFYELACTLISENSVTVEINPLFSKRDSFLGVTKEEIVDHEKVHFLRQGFKGDLFEEPLAYFSSPSKFRRCLGGFIKNPKESFFFVLFSLAMPIFAYLDLYFFYLLNLYIVLMIYLIFRSVSNYLTLSSLKKKLDIITQNRGYECLLRLSSKEILLFRKWSSWEIRDFFHKSQDCPRKAMIAASYLER